MLTGLAASGVMAGAPTGGVGADRKPSFTSQGVDGCLTCHHGMDMKVVGGSPHGNSDNPDTPYNQNGCESCHGPGSFHVSRAYGGQGFPPLIDFGQGAGAADRDVQLGACLACHEKSGNGSPQIGFTGSAHDFGPVTCSRCHQMHIEQESGRTPSQQAESCFSCHAGLRMQHPLMRGKSIDFTRIPCSLCHDVHPVADD